MGVEGPRRVGGGVSSCRGPIGLQPWLPTTGMPGPHPLAGPEWGGGGGPQMLTSGTACPPEPRTSGNRAQGCCSPHPCRPPPAGRRDPRDPTPALPPCWPRLSPGGKRTRRAFETCGEPSTSLDLQPYLPLPRKDKGTIQVRGWRFPEGHGAKHGTVITVIMRAHPGQKPARRLPGPPGFGPQPSPRGQ